MVRVLPMIVVSVGIEPQNNQPQKMAKGSELYSNGAILLALPSR